MAKVKSLPNLNEWLQAHYFLFDMVKGVWGQKNIRSRTELRWLTWKHSSNPPTINLSVREAWKLSKHKSYMSIPKNKKQPNKWLQILMVSLVNQNMLEKKRIGPRYSRLLVRTKSGKVIWRRNTNLWRWLIKVNTRDLQIFAK